MNNGFSFDKITNTEKKQILKTKQDIENSITSVIARAKDCLNSDYFAQYQKEYTEAREMLIDVGISAGQTITDPIQYAFVCRSIFDRLFVLRKLGISVKEDAARPGGNNE